LGDVSASRGEEEAGGKRGPVEGEGDEVSGSISPAYENGRNAGRKFERAAIVAWLRGLRSTREFYRNAANAIERGDHLKGGF